MLLPGGYACRFVICERFVAAHSDTTHADSAELEVA